MQSSILLRDYGNTELVNLWHCVQLLATESEKDEILGMMENESGCCALRRV